MTQTIHTLLTKIQKELKAPKSKYNSFGEYHYRSLEDILEGVKKTLPEGAAVCLSDELIHLGERYYIKATASLCFNGEKVSTDGFAREDLDRKKMHPEQLTGCSSSYARKYALNGLFCIDDTKDADAIEKPEDKKDEVKEITRDHKIFQRNFLYCLANTKTDAEVTSLIEEMGDTFDSLPEYINGQLTDAIGMKRQQFKNGIQAVPSKFGFIDVQEAGEFGVTAKEKIESEKNLDDLREWMIENDHKLKALDAMLSAKKYQTAEGTPCQRLTKAYEKRIQHIAAE